MHGLEVDFKQIMQATYYSKHEVSAKKICACLKHPICIGPAVTTTLVHKHLLVV